MKLMTGILAVLLVLLGFNSVYIVKEGQSALVLQFGRIVRFGDHPGLHFKLPLLQQVIHLDNRILTLEVPAERYFTAEKKSVNVDFYVKWRIANSANYYRATGGNEPLILQRLTPIVKAALRHEFNVRKLQELISGGRQDITASVRKQTDRAARKNLGVTIVDVRIKRIDLPDEVSESVYKRMRAERLQLANELRSTGLQMAETIKADADRQGQIIRAEAERDAAKNRGEGDAQAAVIYARAYGRAPEFFAFYRSLQAYRKAFAAGNGVVILKPGAAFLRYFAHPGRSEHTGMKP